MVPKPLYIILLAAVLLMAHPAMRFSEPIVQTDGISYYVPAKVYSQTLDLDSQNPPWNYDLAYGLVNKLSDYPILTYVTLGIPLRLFGHDIIWLNGLYGAMLFLVHLIFLYLLLKQLTQSKSWSLIGTAMGTLNIRLYFLFYAGMFPTALGVCLTTPALYYLYRYYESGSWKHMSLAGIFTLLVGLAYPQQMMLLALMTLCIWLGVYMESKFSLRLPKISLDVRKIRMDCLAVLPVLLAGIIAAIVFIRYAFLKSTTAGFASSFLHTLLFTRESTYPLMWKMPFLLDNPLIFLLAVISFAVLLYTQRWRIVLPIAAVGTVLFFAVWFVPDIWVRVYFYRYFAEFAILLGVLAILLLAKLWTHVELRKEVTVIVVLILLVEIAKLLMFFSFVQPAITPDEMAAARMVHDMQGKVLFYNNIGEDSDFRSFYWVVTLSEKEQFRYLSEKLEIDPDVTILLVQDDTLITADGRALFDNWHKEQSYGVVAVYSR